MLYGLVILKYVIMKNNYYEQDMKLKEINMIVPNAIEINKQPI